MAGDAKEAGIYPLFTCSKETKRIGEYSFNQEALLLTVGGKSNIKYFSGKFDATILVYALTLEHKYIYGLFELINYFLPFFDKMSRGTTIPRLSIEGVKNFEVPLSPDNLLDLFNKFAEPIQKHIDSLSKQIDTFQVIKQELIERIYSQNLKID